MLRTILGCCLLAGAAWAAVDPSTNEGTVVEHDKVMACYFGSWSFYRPGYGKFDVDDIDPTLCTHGFYGFADLDNQTWTIYVYDPWYDLAPEDCDPGYCNFNSYRRFVDLKQKNPDFVPMISIGGWNAGSGKYSMMAKDPAKRKTFIDSIVPFAKKYGFEGVDLDWEYPGSRTGADPDVDKQNFNVLLKELKEALEPEGLLFTAALSPGKGTIDVAYDIPEISKYLDLMNVMSYDYHGWWENKSHPFTGHNAPIFRREEEIYTEHPGYYFNVYDTVKYWLDKGAPKEKVVMGMPLYGRGFHLEHWEDPYILDGLYCPADDGIAKGPYTQQIGIWGYQEILQAFNNETLINLPDAIPGGWKITRDGCYKAPYAVNGPWWIGYDDQESLEYKAKFVNFLGVAGSMVWSVDTDDFSGTYFSETYHLLRTINRVMGSNDVYNPDIPNCKSAPLCDITDQPDLSTYPPLTTTTEQSTTSGGDLSNQCKEHNEVFPYPGDCHRYFRCTLNGDHFDVTIYTCGDDAFDPNINACVDSQLPANEHLCNGNL